MIESEWLFDPDYEFTCFICGKVLPRRLVYLWGGELCCDKCLTYLEQKEGCHGSIKDISGDGEYPKRGRGNI